MKITLPKYDDSDPVTGRYMLVALAISIVVTAVLFFVPFGRTIGRPLILFSTYAHEMGHGIAAALVGGEFDNFKMWSNGSGVARTLVPSSGFARAMVSAGGLVGPAVLAAILFVIGRRPKWSRYAMITLGAACLISVAWVVRNAFGVWFVAAVGASFILIGLFANNRIAHIALLFLATQLGLTVFSRGDYLFMQYASTSEGKMPSDVQNMADALFGPFWLWGALVGLFSVAVLVGGIWMYVRAVAAAPDGAPKARSPRPRSAEG